MYHSTLPYINILSVSYISYGDQRSHFESLKNTWESSESQSEATYPLLYLELLKSFFPDLAEQDFIIMEKDPRRKLLIFTILMAVILLVFNLQDDALDSGGLSLSWKAARKDMNFNLTRLIRGKARSRLVRTGFSCRSDFHTEQCIIDKKVIVVNGAQTIYVPSFPGMTKPAKLQVRPYARREDKTAMDLVTPIQIALHGNSTSTNLPICQSFDEDVPAVIFSTGGFTGNSFHEFNEIIIPLFMTTRHFQSKLRFIITDYTPWWVVKYGKVLKALSSYQVINGTHTTDVRCFPGAVVGLGYCDNLALETSATCTNPGGYSMADFRYFLRQAYDLKVDAVSKTSKQQQQGRGLLLIARRETRVFSNLDQMMRMMGELGFRVRIAIPEEMPNLDKFSEVVNSCDVMVGAHGAGITNSLFLPSGAVLVQVVPLGLEWASENYYGKPTQQMDLKYLEYRVEPEESSLIDVYGPDDPVIRDPDSVYEKGYRAVRAVYVDGQNMTINLVRFKQTLIKALKLLE